MLKRQFKVISPIDRKDGSKYWIKCGSAFLNKDNSINVYLDAMPLHTAKDGQGVTLQLRELTDEELRERAEKRATYSARGTLGTFNTSSPLGSAVADNNVPF